MQMQSQSQTGDAARLRDDPGRMTAQGPLPAPVVEIGARHGFGRDATRALWSALLLGRGAMAQFSHAEFGGSGQWMRGGMLMIGDMFNRQLAARVGALCDDLSLWLAEHPEAAASSGAAAIARESEWWPAGLHSPATSGAQNGMRYAYFPDQRRLAIERNGGVELYDTGDHLIGGVSQQQGGADALTFASQRGAVDLATLRRIGQESATPPTLQPRAETSPDASPARRPDSATASHQSGDVLATIERLAALHERGVLTDAEFTAKKTELLGRL
ncbi:SHOCT domain-containing protein [Variovorax sp. GT1P44]|uniref:SHOCT domain-containing protein n=1 Tax=Variovorax sp. GT1P44 TaxID=3443742 RepID=UPI003F447E86